MKREAKHNSCLGKDLNIGSCKQTNLRFKNNLKLILDLVISECRNLAGEIAQEYAKRQVRICLIY